MIQCHCLRLEQSSSAEFQKVKTQLLINRLRYQLRRDAVVVRFNLIARISEKHLLAIYPIGIDERLSLSGKQPSDKHVCFFAFDMRVSCRIYFDDAVLVL